MKTPTDEVEESMNMVDLHPSLEQVVPVEGARSLVAFEPLGVILAIMP